MLFNKVHHLLLHKVISSLVNIVGLFFSLKAFGDLLSVGNKTELKANSVLQSAYPEIKAAEQLNVLPQMFETTD